LILLIISGTIFWTSNVSAASIAENIPPYLAPLAGMLGIGQSIAKAITGKEINIWVAPFNLLLTIILGLISGILYFLNYFLVWAFSNPLGVSFTDPAHNKIIELGWTLLRDFVNMLFVLGLAYIGLATALDFGRFNTQKTFFRLLLIALLINFTPLICGVIVDVSNIVSKAFLPEPDFSKLIKPFFDGKSFLDIAAGLTDTSNLVKLPVLIAYGILCSFVLFIFGIIFLLRPVIIWMLVVFSPLAFFAWIFDKTRKYFERWWNWFLLWSFVAIPASFFLYLSQHILAEISALNISKISADPTEGMYTDLAPYFVILLFMGVGVMASMQATSATVTPLISGVRTGVAKTRKYLRKGGRFGLAVGGAIEGAKEGIKQEEGMGKIKGFFKGMFTKEGRTIGKARFAERLEKAHLVRKGFGEELKKEMWKIDKEVERLEKLSDDTIEKILQSKPLTAKGVREQFAAFYVAAKRGKIKDEHADIAKRMQRLGIDIGNAYQRRPDLIPKINLEKIQKLQTEKNLSQQEAEIEAIFQQIRKMPRGKFVQNVQSEALKDWRVIAGMDDEQLRHLGRTGTGEQKVTLAKTIKANKREIRELLENLERRGQIEEANRITRLLEEFRSNPNFQQFLEESQTIISPPERGHIRERKTY